MPADSDLKCELFAFGVFFELEFGKSLENCPELETAMKLSQYRIYMLIHAAIAVAVIFIFKLIDERKIAALIAGTLFIVGPSYVLWNEWRLGLALKKVTWWTTLVFLCLSALPIFLLRIIYWDQAFENISALGITGQQMHAMSSYIFILMLLGFFVDSFIERRQRIQALGPKHETDL